MWSYDRALVQFEAPVQSGDERCDCSTYVAHIAVTPVRRFTDAGMWTVKY